MRAVGRAGRRVGIGLTAGWAVVAGLAPAAMAASPSLAATAGGAPGPYARGEAIVRFESGTSARERRDVRHQADVDFEEGLGLARTELVEVDGAVAAAIRRLERLPAVAYAQPNYRYEALAVEAPDDTFFDQLWGLSDPAEPDPGVSALEAWEHGFGSGQVIAIVDTGVDLTHPDLEPNLWTNALESLGLEGVDEDLNGRTDDVHGYDFVDDDGDPDEYEFHGTHVAGTATAVADNGKGVAGVAPEAEIMAVRVLDGDGGGFSAEIAEGIAYAAENGADVINLSLGGPADAEDQLTEDAIEIAAAEDAMVVAAAGNEGVDNDADPHTPCALQQPNLICVAALGQAGSLAEFSNFGVETVDIAAPGTSVLSTKVDYAPPVVVEDFESGFGSTWDRAVSSGGIEWGPTSLGGNDLATDSPLPSQDYAPEAVSALFMAGDVNLTGERGCRVHFKTMYEIEEFFDAFEAGAFSEAPTFDLRIFDGTSLDYPSSLVSEEASISDMDGRNDVHPLFRVASDEIEELDGAYVDDVRLICRDETYVDAIASGAEYDQAAAGNYIRFSGTSMAAPHVAGVAALVRSAAPGASALQAIDAILTGASAIPNPSFSRRTATEGIADACQAIAVATGGDVAADCPGSSENVIPPPPVSAPGVGSDAVTVEEPPPVGDQRRPSTFFKERPSRVVRTRASKARVVFRFDSNESGVTFVCRVDGGLFRPCGARLTRRFRVGFHVLRVVARDAAGNVDSTPAVARFRVKRRR